MTHDAMVDTEMEEATNGTTNGTTANTNGGGTEVNLKEVPPFSLTPVIQRLLQQDRTKPWTSDGDYYEAVLACESARLTAFRLQRRIASSVFTVDSKLFANASGGTVMTGVKLAELMQELTLKLDSIRQDKLAAMETTLPVLELFLQEMQATNAEKKVFRFALAITSGMAIMPQGHRGRLDQMGINMSAVRDVFEDDFSLNDLMKLVGARSKWVQEKVYKRTSSPSDPFASIPNVVLSAFMGIELTLTQYRELESATLQKVLREHPWFQATATGKAVLRQQQEPSKDLPQAPLAPAPLVAALASAKNEMKNVDAAPSKPQSRDRVFKALSRLASSELAVVGSSSSQPPPSKKPKTEAPQATGETSTPHAVQDDFGPYPSELAYLEDQVRLMRTEVALNKIKVKMDTILLDDDEKHDSSYPFDPLDYDLDRYGRPKNKTKEDQLLDKEREAQKLETKLQKLKEKIAIKLAATTAQKGHLSTPRLEQLCQALHLTTVEKYVILDLVTSVIMPMSQRGRMDAAPRGHIGSMIERFSTSLADKMKCRQYFYKSATLIKEGILTITQQDFMTDLTQCKISLDRRMFDFIVGLDTEFSELVDGSHLYNPNVSLEDVVLNDETKKRVCDCVLSFDKVKDEYQRLDISDKISYGLGHVLLFYGASGTGKTMLANAVAAKLKKKVLLVNFPSLGSNQSGAIIKFMFREARINNALLFFDECESIFMTRDKGSSSVNMILSELEQFEDLCILCTNRPAELDEAMHRRITLAIEFQKPDHILRERIWKQLHPPKLALDDNVDFGELARKFTLTGGLIKNAWLLALGLMVQRGGDKVTQDDLVQAAKEQVIGTLTLEEFDLRVVPTSGIETVIVSDSLKESLSNIVQHTKAQSVLFGQWGFGKLHRAPTGISALFCGPPGTGKSMAAEAIGFDLGMPLKVVNVAALLSKWVGETGKNIQAVFDDAKKKNAVLVFEEAEGLFGKRSTEGTASRHDNMNVGLLLQNIENFPGVCVVVTNLKKIIDEAFFRRFQFILDFEPPTAVLRTRLWKSIVPKECPLASSVSLEDLARKYEMCGGNIKSALFRAASRAALRDEAKDRVITMKDLEDSCSEEMKKGDGGRANLDMYV